MVLNSKSLSTDDDSAAPEDVGDPFEDDEIF